METAKQQVKMEVSSCIEKKKLYIKENKKALA